MVISRYFLVNLLIVNQYQTRLEEQERIKLSSGLKEMEVDERIKAIKRMENLKALKEKKKKAAAK